MRETRQRAEEIKTGRRSCFYFSPLLLLFRANGVGRRRRGGWRRVAGRVLCTTTIVGSPASEQAACAFLLRFSCLFLRPVVSRELRCRRDWPPPLG